MRHSQIAKKARSHQFCQALIDSNQNHNIILCLYVCYLMRAGYNDIRKKMFKKIKSQFTILKQCSISKSKEISNQTVILQSNVRIKSTRNYIHKLLLLQNELVLEIFQQQQTRLFSVQLEFSLKMEGIQKKYSYGKTKLSGFKLYNDYEEEISIFFNSPRDSKKWVKVLGKMITQTRFNELFKAIRTLGKGGSGSVYEVQRLADSQRLAAKVFEKNPLKESYRKLNSFFNQVEILKSIDHQNLVAFEGVFQSQNSYEVVMEHLEGGNLLHMLAHRKQRLTLAEIRELMKGILSGLAHLHTLQIVHRDIKLENIMLREKDSLEAVIVDFGLSVYADDEDYYFYQCGTQGYIPPEFFQLKNGDILSPVADIFSLGVIMHVLLTGRFLFQGKNFQQLITNNTQLNFDLTSPEYQSADSQALDLMRKMLEKDPKKRWSAQQCLSHKFLNQQNFKAIHTYEFESKTQEDSSHLSFNENF